MNNKQHILKCHGILDIDIIEATQAVLTTSNNKKIIDFEAGIWCTALGHNNEAINSVIADQITKVSHLNTRLVSPWAEKLANLLTEITGLNHGKATFLSSGSEAVEMAITLAKLVTNKSKLLSFNNSYLSAYSHMSMPRSQKIFTEIDFRHCNSCNKHYKCLNCPVVKNIDFSKIAAFVFEPGNTSGKVILPNNKLVEFLVHQVQNNGGLLVINEVTTGFGRTGMWFGYNHYNIKPNIIAMGKALGNGYPISAVVMDKNTAFEVENKKFTYAQSHQNDPLGCRIACQVISQFKKQELLKKSQELSQFFIKSLQTINSKQIRGVRGRGLMLALELNKENLASLMYKELLKRGFLVGYHPTENILRFYPTLLITKQQILALCDEIATILTGV
ncbi:aspartate aminotransferase family protein [Clostridium sp. 'deep sea']|uniref:aminotransferase class III-fold pyridoxal phosphate-dependent enzyme n=1 Tax=Clostridium sp. 'deep sea' TaxID=2779445 RepID=UPI0018969507|nr:aminotransferase class III-fold pyridoxal phosphate-dependent enzyme [Clostridium sp. 'deep sea']QOR36679.1 aspartate aminotransferase family protein [Clostridium sp. 'deep sea']